MSQAPPPSNTAVFPETLDLGLLRRLRANLVKLNERDEIVRQDGRERQQHFVATMPSGKALYAREVESIPTREATHARYAQHAREFGKDLVILRNWLEKRAVQHAKAVAEKRVTLSQTLIAHYSDPTRMASLAAAISQMLCYRVGYPLLLTQEKRGSGSGLPDLWDVTNSSEIQRRMAARLPPPKWRAVKNPDGGTSREMEPPKFSQTWGVWSGDADHNHSPFQDRFAAMNAVFGPRTAQAARLALYADHPILLALATSATPPELARIIIMRDVTERNVALGVLIFQIAAQITQSATDLLADVSVDQSMAFTVPGIGLSFNADYVDWGNHMPLLLLAVSELQLAQDDPLKAYLLEVLLPKMDVMSWRETADATLMIVGIAATVLSLGGAAAFVSAAIALEVAGVMMAAAGLASASAQIYEGAVAEDRMAAEQLLGHFADDLAGYENGQVAADGVQSLMIELLTLGLFPPTIKQTRAMTRGRLLRPKMDPRPGVGNVSIPPSEAGALSVAPRLELPHYTDVTGDLIADAGQRAQPERLRTRSVLERDIEPIAEGSRATTGQRSLATPQDQPRTTTFAEPSRPDLDDARRLIEGTDAPDLQNTQLVRTPQQSVRPEPTLPTTDIGPAARAVTAVARSVTTQTSPDPNPDEVVLPHSWDDVVLTRNAKAEGTVLAQRLGVTRNAATYNRNYLADLSVEDSGLRFSGRKAYRLVYKLRSSPAFSPEEQDKILERIALMNSSVADLITDSGLPLRLKRPDDPHVKTNQTALISRAQKAARKAGNTKAGDYVDVDEVWARNLFEYAIDLSSDRPELEAAVQIELPRWINGFFGQFDTVLRDLIAQNSEDGFESFVIGARVEFPD